jgi:type I site-specific restriction endonuclease
VSSRLSPEQQARIRIDRMLEDAGWVVLDYADADFSAGAGVAIREFMTPKGPMDYLLVADRKVVGSVEAKKEGETLRQVEVQADRYADGFEELVKTRNLPRYADRVPFHYISTGVETLFTSRRDPIRRPREVFHFHRPETLAAWATEATPYRARLRQLPSNKPLRRVTVHVLPAAGLSYNKIIVAVNGKIKATTTHHPHGERVTLDSLPKGRFSVKVTVLTRTGGQIVGKRSYRSSR